MVRRPDAGAVSVIGNVIWFLLAGWWLAIGHVITGVLMALFGVVRERGRDPRNRQPFALSIHNVDERPGDAGDEDFFIGTYDWDGSLLYLRGDDERVYRGTRESVAPLTEWDSLESMLLSEFDRLSEHFDEQGRERDPDRPTIPSWSSCGH